MLWHNDTCATVIGDNPYRDRGEEYLCANNADDWEKQHGAEISDGVKGDRQDESPRKRSSPTTMLDGAEDKECQRNVQQRSKDALDNGECSNANALP